MPTLEKPRIEDVDPETGKPRYQTYAEYEDVKDAWNRQEAIREFQASLAKQPRRTGNDLGITIIGVVVLAFFVYGGLRGHSTANASASDPHRDEQIKDLSDRIAKLETRHTDHQYELRVDGLRTFRFDPVTGSTCIQLTTEADWKRPETVRQGCQYQDWAFGEGATSKDYFNAECQLVRDKKACDQFMAMASK